VSRLTDWATALLEAATSPNATDYLRKDLTWSASGGSGAPTTATYLTLTVDAGLSNERVLTAGTGIVFVDLGAGSTLTVLADTLDTIPDPVASVDFAQQQALRMRLENRTSDPGTPAEGEIWLRTDL